MEEEGEAQRLAVWDRAAADAAFQAQRAQALQQQAELDAQVLKTSSPQPDNILSAQPEGRGTIHSVSGDFALPTLSGCIAAVLVICPFLEHACSITLLCLDTGSTGNERLLTRCVLIVSALTSLYVCAAAAG